jgi:hypothetical protein
MKTATTRLKRGGRYPRGYGLPSLVVVLFLVSVLVSAIVDQFARDVAEGRASAAFNITQDRLHAFEITGGDGAGLLPHLIPSRDVTLDLVPAGFGQPAAALVSSDFRSGREGVLFDQKIRAFLNVPVGDSLGLVRQTDLRRRHPERVLRDGDRMGTPLDLWDIPGSAASLLNAGETRSGTAEASGEAITGLLSGSDGSLFEAPLFSGARVIARDAEVSGAVSGLTGTVAGALISPSVTARTMEVSGLLRGRDALTPDTRVIGNFATDSLDNQDLIYFNRVIASGVRVEMGQANRLTFGDRFGPSPGALEGSLPLVNPDVIFEDRP